MMDQDAIFTMVAQHHAVLREMASHRSPSRFNPRKLLGRSLMRIGRWIEGHQPRPALDTFVEGAVKLTANPHNEAGIDDRSGRAAT